MFQFYQQNPWSGTFLQPVGASLGAQRCMFMEEVSEKYSYSSFLDLLQCDLASSKGSVVTMICKKRQIQQWKITS